METAASLATWFFTGWRKALDESVWPDRNDGRLVSIVNLTALEPLDRGTVNTANVLSRLHSLPLATLQTERDRRSEVTRRAREGFAEHALQTVTSPNLPDPNPIGSLLAGLFGNLKDYIVPIAIVGGGLWYLSTRKDRHE